MILHILAGATLLVAAITDLRSRRIPNALILVSAIAGTLGLMWLPPSSASEIASRWGWAVGVWLLFALMARRRWMGHGDAKLLGLLALLLGAQDMLESLMLACLAALPVALLRRLREPKSAAATKAADGNSNRATLPLGPFLAVGFCIFILHRLLLHAAIWPGSHSNLAIAPTR
jgi:prepilin peptidase CpaA